jgi:hypothetical protein
MVAMRMIRMRESQYIAECGLRIADWITDDGRWTMDDGAIEARRGRKRRRAMAAAERARRSQSLVGPRVRLMRLQ